MQQRGDLYLVQGVFRDVQLSRHPNRPLRQASAVDAGAEVLQVKQLVESADHRVAKGGIVLFKFLDAHQQQRSPVLGHKRAAHIRSELVDQYVWHACTARYVSRRPYPNWGLEIDAACANPDATLELVQFPLVPSIRAAVPLAKGALNEVLHPAA